MNREETATLLSAMASLDRRTIGAADVIAWQGLLTDVSYADALEAVKRHYAAETTWMMPAHVLRLVDEIELEQRRAERKWAPGQAGVPPEQAYPEIERGAAMDAAIAAMPPEVRALLDKIAANRGVDGARALRPRREFWDREHKAYLRSHSGEPNPLYKPSGGTRCLKPEPHGKHDWESEGVKFWCRGTFDAVDWVDKSAVQAEGVGGLPCRWCHAKTGHNVGCHAYGE